jgi:hypothetical protein
MKRLRRSFLHCLPWLSVLLCFPGLHSTAKGFDVDAALQWLADHQQKNGRWGFSLAPVAGEQQQNGCQCHENDAPVPPANNVPDNPRDLRATALVTLAFLSAGNTHQEGKHCDAVKRAMAVLEKQALGNNGRMFVKNGVIVQDHGMFIQAYAAQALVECFLRTGDQALEQAAQLAIDEICRQRNNDGGWAGALPAAPAGLVAMNSNLHATYCNVIALYLAQAAGLKCGKIDPVRGAGEWLPNVEQVGPPAGYTEASNVGLPNPRALPSGLLLRATAGLDAAGNVLPLGPPRAWVNARMADLAAKADDPSDPFYLYAKALVMERIGNPAWVPAFTGRLGKNQWNAIKNKPHRNGSVNFPVMSDQDGHKGGSRLYWTAMAVLIAQSQGRAQLIFGKLPLWPGANPLPAKHPAAAESDPAAADSD